MVRTVLLIGLGGGIGSILRYLTTVFITKNIQAIFPWGTFVVNMVGCLLIGLLLGLLERHQLSNPDFRLLFITGFCGGYTTFSTFASENYNLLQSGHSFTAFLYIAFSIILSLFAVWLGISITK